MICLKDNIGLKYMIKINVSPAYFFLWLIENFFNMADRNFFLIFLIWLIENLQLLLWHTFLFCIFLLGSTSLSSLLFPL